jgi:hypothetical protein
LLHDQGLGSPVQMIQEGWGGGGSKVWVEVGVALVSNPLSKRYSNYEVREVGVVQQLCIRQRFPCSDSVEKPNSVRIKIRIA